MAKYNRTTLKGYFETGDIPSQAQYGDLIDSKLNLSDTGTQVVEGTISSSFLEVANHITASGNISASGILTAEGLVISDDATITDDLTVNGNAIINGSITGPTRFTFDSGEYIDTADGVITTGVDDGLFVQSNITASGNISASFTSTGSFGSAMLTNLPTVEPLVSGALWLSGSGGGSASGSKYLMVFNG